MAKAAKGGIFLDVFSPPYEAVRLARTARVAISVSAQPFPYPNLKVPSNVFPLYGDIFDLKSDSGVWASLYNLLGGERVSAIQCMPVGGWRMKREYESFVCRQIAAELFNRLWGVLVIGGIFALGSNTLTWTWGDGLHGAKYQNRGAHIFKKEEDGNILFDFTCPLKQYTNLHCKK